MFCIFSWNFSQSFGEEAEKAVLAASRRPPIFGGNQLVGHANRGIPALDYGGNRKAMELSSS